MVAVTYVAGEPTATFSPQREKTLLPFPFTPSRKTVERPTGRWGEDVAM